MKVINSIDAPYYLASPFGATTSIPNLDETKSLQFNCTSFNFKVIVINFVRQSTIYSISQEIHDISTHTLSEEGHRCSSQSTRDSQAGANARVEASHMATATALRIRPRMSWYEKAWTGPNDFDDPSGWHGHDGRGIGEAQKVHFLPARTFLAAESNHVARRIFAPKGSSQIS